MHNNFQIVFAPVGARIPERHPSYSHRLAGGGVFDGKAQCMINFVFSFAIPANQPSVSTAQMYHPSGIVFAGPKMAQ